MLWDLWPINWEKSQFFHWKQQICHFYIEIDLGTILKINFRHCSFHPSMNWIKYWSTTLEMKGANWTFSLKNDQTSNLAGRPGRGDRTKVPEQKLFLFTSSTKTALHPLTFLSYKKSMHPNAHAEWIDVPLWAFELVRKKWVFISKTNRIQSFRVAVFFPSSTFVCTRICFGECVCERALSV